MKPTQQKYVFTTSELVQICQRFNKFFDLTKSQQVAVFSLSIIENDDNYLSSRWAGYDGSFGQFYCNRDATYQREILRLVGVTIDGTQLRLLQRLFVAWENKNMAELFTSKKVPRFKKFECFGTVHNWTRMVEMPHPYCDKAIFLGYDAVQRW